MNAYVPSRGSKTNGFDHQIDQLFEEAVRAITASDNLWAPACNAWEDKEGFHIQVALPGWEPKDIALEVENQVLTVKGQRTVESTASQAYHLREIADGRFTRLLRLPPSVDPDKASALHMHGLLTITFPVREEAKPRQIPIEGS